MTPDTVKAIKPRPNLNLITGEGPQLGAVPVASIDSFGMCEDDNTLMVLVELVDGRTVSLSLCPGQPIQACLA